ncbi:hypothetical protein C3B64_01510 [Clostridium botulinum]|uniref:Uncharacterized protein n=2 Tax=Clostridium TaxID=1485 RepID=A0AAU8YUN4_CLOBO|nr:hypothetical protein [Clostridium sporogenes]AVP62999.1 hypothetical protein C3B64_01510 [Clostridium botulinum]AKC60908.1 hypothetical protein CLSPO_c01710 [Clostridium sporogenes]AKJ88265.1 hypothetical protein CLSPOx_00855 [Clostridium sporogenes]KCZ70180.1 hypothetical protein CSPO_1c02780 [Clostridium sporogenes]MCF4018282.1 hypothetical protein [Clostridium sporogenes]
MTKFLKTLPMLLSFLVSYIILMQIDRKYHLMSKINFSINVPKDWKPMLYVSFMLILIIFIPIIDIFPDEFNYILNGIILSITVILTQKNT